MLRILTGLHIASIQGFTQACSQGPDRVYHQLKPLRALSVRMCLLVFQQFHWPALRVLTECTISYSRYVEVTLCTCATAPYKRHAGLW